MHVTVDNLCTFHVMHSTSLSTCTDVNKENLYRSQNIEGRQITRMIRINHALQRRHTLNYWNCIYIKIYTRYTLSKTGRLLVTWYLSPHRPQQKELRSRMSKSVLEVFFRLNEEHWYETVHLLHAVSNPESRRVTIVLCEALHAAGIDFITSVQKAREIGKI